MPELFDTLRNLKNGALIQWATETIFRRGNAYTDHVEPVHLAPNGALMAAVNGTERYLTALTLGPGNRLQSLCTCPYDDGPCKHAVALALVAREALQMGATFPRLDPDDEDADAGDLFGLDDPDDWDDEDDDLPMEWTSRTQRRSMVADALKGRKRETLERMLIELSEAEADIAQSVLDWLETQQGQSGGIAKRLRQRIIQETSREAWANPWEGIGDIPDFGPILMQLNELLHRGEVKTVVELGELLLDRGAEQAEAANDDGEALEALSECVPVVLDAVHRHPDWPPVRRLTWLIDRIAADQWQLFDNALEAALEDERYSAAHWGELADTLEARLRAAASARPGGYSQHRERLDLLDLLILTRRRAGQFDRLPPVLEALTDAIASYLETSEVYRELGDVARARHWAIHGHGVVVTSAPGTAADLREQLYEIAEHEGDTALAAAYLAQAVCEQFGTERYTALREATQSLGCWPTVRTAVLRHLETGQAPDSDPAWPLPAPEVSPPKDHSTPRYPRGDALIQAALLDKEPDTALHWYRRYPAVHLANEVTTAVLKTQPSAAFDIWADLADREIARVKPSAYARAMGWMKRMQTAAQQYGLVPEWQRYLAGVRAEHRAKRRLMDMLNTLPPV